MSTDHSIDYRIINFLTVFATTSNLVKCAKCNGSVKFQVASQRALGFKIATLCNNCNTQYVPSYLFVGTGYEINRIFTLAMSVLGYYGSTDKEPCHEKCEKGEERRKTLTYIVISLWQV